MHLLIITAVQAYEKDIKKLLKENRVKVFSYLDVTGYKDLSDYPLDSSWFASSGGEHQSTLFYAFVENGSIDRLFAAIEAFNRGQDSRSYIHAVLLNVSRSI